MTETADGIYGGTIFEHMEGATYRDPQQSYAAMRDGAPAQRAGEAVVAVTRAAVDEVFRHPEIYSSRNAPGFLGNVRPLIPLEVDPPEHKKFRKIMDPLFAPSRMQRLAEPIERLVNDLIDGFIDQPEIDFSQQFSIPFPSQVFLTLLGLPLDETRRFIAMKDGISRPFHVLGVPMNSPEARAHQAKTGQELYDYFETLLDERQRVPQDDLLTHFLTAEVGGHRLSREDILDVCFLFFIAGLDTVSGVARVLLRLPGRASGNPSVARSRPRPDPAGRRRAPSLGITGHACIAHSDPGHRAHWMPCERRRHGLRFVASANTDEDALPDAGEVRLDRETNPHIAFGGGVHRCLGSHLARLELRTALQAWHVRIPHYRVKPGFAISHTVGIRSLDSFPMLLGQSA